MRFDEVFHTVLYWEIRANTAGPCSAQKGRIWPRPVRLPCNRSHVCVQCITKSGYKMTNPISINVSLFCSVFSWGVLNDLGWHDKIMKMQKQWQSDEEATSTTSCAAVDSSPSRILSRVFLTVKEMRLFACCHSVKHCAESPGTKVDTHEVGEIWLLKKESNKRKNTHPLHTPV